MTYALDPLLYSEIPWLGSVEDKWLVVDVFGMLGWELTPCSGSFGMWPERSSVAFLLDVIFCNEGVRDVYGIV